MNETPWDETRGWIFSDEYHKHEDRLHRTRSAYRGGGEYNVREHGWYLGLYTVKHQIYSDNDKARWPVPQDIHKLPEGTPRDMLSTRPGW